MRVDQPRSAASLLILGIVAALSALVVVPLALAEAPSPSKTPAVSHRIKHEHNHVSPRYYWASEKLGRIRSFEVEDDVVYVTIFEHHGPQPYWLTGAEMRDGAEKARGYRDALLHWESFLRSTIDREQQIGVQNLQAATDLPFAAAFEWLVWLDEHRDFVRWDDTQQRYVIDEERKIKRLAEAVKGLRLTLTLDKSTYVVGEPIRAVIRLDNIYPASGEADRHLWVNARGAWHAEVAVELRTHERHDVGYHHWLPPPPPPLLRREDFALLDGGQGVEWTFELTSHLTDRPLKPAKYSVKVHYRNQATGAALGLPPTGPSQFLPHRGPAWTGYLETLEVDLEVD